MGQQGVAAIEANWIAAQALRDAQAPPSAAADDAQTPNATGAPAPRLDTMRIVALSRERGLPRHR